MILWTFSVFGLALVCSFVFMFLLLRTFRLSARKREEMLCSLDKKNTCEHPDTGMLGISYVSTTVLWSIVFGIYLYWLLTA